MKTQRTKDKGFGTGSRGTGDKVKTDRKRQETGAEPRKRTPIVPLGKRG